MKNLNNYFLQSKKISSIDDYITEKLRLDKDIKYLSVIDKILNIFNLKNQIIFDKEDLEKISEKIQKEWIDKYNISNIECIITLSIYKEYKYIFDSVKGLYRIDEYDYQYFNGKSKTFIYNDSKISIQDITSYHSEYALKLSNHNNFELIFVKI